MFKFRVGKVFFFYLTGFIIIHKTSFKLLTRAFSILATTMGIQQIRPFPNLWYKVYGHIVKQGYFLCGIPFTFDNDLIYIPSAGGDRRFKLYMAWFTFYNLLYVINYIPILFWGTEEDLNTYAFYICHTLVHLAMWILLCVVLVKRYECCAVTNALLDFVRKFNGMMIFSL
jgi:hypothetical protein